MKIESISRKISGFNYDNISATATIGECENPVEAAKQLDAEIRKMLNAITDQEETVRAAQREKDETTSLLERALKHAREEEYTFEVLNDCLF